MFRPMKIVKGYLSWMMMRYNGLLEDLGCLGTALVELLGGEVDFKVMDGFEVVLVDEFTLVLVNVGVYGRGGAGALREPVDSNRSFPVISTPKMFSLHLKLCDTCWISGPMCLILG